MAFARPKVPLSEICCGNSIYNLTWRDSPEKLLLESKEIIVNMHEPHLFPGIIVGTETVGCTVSTLGRDGSPVGWLLGFSLAAR